ncbi:MAG: orotate phosphoribosyltransferase [Candidatus Eremiobacteraeota bacterium]|nr:orotate phosphoribosyltransferase [Candidatus Eremiobacteraeota bacterium]
MRIFSEYAGRIAQAGLEIKAIRLDAREPFQWVSGYRMPIYNDNRMFLFFPEYRKLITGAFDCIIKEKNIAYEVIAGTATAGIPFGMALAESLQAPFVYVRPEAKDHGMGCQVEGLGRGNTLGGRKVVLIEDLISTGRSSALAVRALRAAGGTVSHCLAVFSYGFDEAEELFLSMRPPCELIPIFAYDVLLEKALETGYLSQNEVSILREWRHDPFGWGAKHGFPRVVKGE